MSPELLSEWQAHLAMEVSAAATLLGLVFVAASINLARIASTPALPGRVLESVVQFVQVLFISMLMTIPRQSSATLAIEVMAVSFLSWAIQLVVFTRSHRARLGNPRWWLIARIVLAHLAIIPFLIFAGCLFFHPFNAFYWAVPGFFFSFVAGLMNSWVLLINVRLRVKYSRDFPEPGVVQRGQVDR